MKVTLEFESLSDLKNALREIQNLGIEPEAKNPSVSAAVPAKVKAPEPVPETKEQTVDPTCTKDDIARTAVSLMDRGLEISTLTELLNRYGVESVPELKPENYDAFMTDLKKLGGAL